MLVWRSTRRKEILYCPKGLKAQLPLKSFSSIKFEYLQMSTKRKQQRYFTKQSVVGQKKIKKDDDNDVAKKLETQVVKKLEKKLIDKLDGACLDNDSVICQASPPCEASEPDEIEINFSKINKYYCTSKDYRMIKSYQGFQGNELFAKKAEEFINYHFGLGLNDRNAPTKIYSVGYTSYMSYSMNCKDVRLIWKGYGLSNHPINHDCSIVECGYVRDLDSELHKDSMRNYLANLAKFFKLEGAFAVIIANGGLCLNSVHVIPCKNLIILEISDNRDIVALKNRNLVNFQVIYELLSKVHFECKYSPVDFSGLINFSDCCPLVIRAGKDNLELLQNFKGNIVDYAQDCDEPLNFLISFVLKYFGKHHAVFNCSSILLTCNCSFDLLETLKLLCNLLNQVYSFVDKSKIQCCIMHTNTFVFVTRLVLVNPISTWD